MSNATVDQKVRAHMTALGFDVVETGGGCTAYERVADDESYLMITAATGPEIPMSMIEPIVVGFYNHFGENVATLNIANVKVLTQDAGRTA